MNWAELNLDDLAIYHSAGLSLSDLDLRLVDAHRFDYFGHIQSY